MRPALACASLALLLAVVPVRAQDGASSAPAASARARQPPPRTSVAVRLEYSLGPGAGNCPDESYLRQEVARRMGRDLFAADAMGVPVGRVHVVIARSPQGLTGTYDFFDTAGVRQWTRTYSEPSTIRQACRDINQGVAVELANEFTITEIELACHRRARRVPLSAGSPGTGSHRFGGAL